MSDFPAHSHQSLVNYCERCGTVLTGRQIEGKLLPACPACDHIAYLDPKVAAGVILTLNGKLVLLKRGIEPSVGKWVFPGGYVDRDEPVPVARAQEGPSLTAEQAQILSHLSLVQIPMGNQGKGPGGRKVLSSRPDAMKEDQVIPISAQLLSLIHI